LLRLAALLDRKDYREKGENVIDSAAGLLKQYASGFGRMLAAVDFYVGPSQEIAITGDPGPFLSILRKQYLPRTVIAAGTDGNIALLQNRPMLDGKPTAYICENFACKQPVTDPAAFEQQLNF
jgi:uncharacterized protein YyaL (SSP411 family)